MRVACLYIPHFYLQAEYLKDPSLRDKPIVIIGLPQEKGYVMDCSEELSERGIVPLMPLKDAYHMCFDAVPVMARKKEYQAFWDEILCAIAPVTLRIESQEPGMVFLDITRLPGMYKSEEQIACALSRIIADQFFFDVRIGVGNSRFIARKAANRAKDILVIPPGAERQFVSSVGIDSLPVPDDIRERLHLLGLDSLGQIGAFTLSALTSQFGAIGKKLWEITNGVGDRDRIPCAFAITDIDREIICDQPVSSQQEIRAVLLEILDGLSLELEELGKACRTIKVTFDLENRTFFEKQFYLHDPTIHREDMLRRMMMGIQGIELESPIRIVSVRAGSLVNYNGRQENLFRNKNGLEKSMKEIRGFLKTKYGTMPLARVVRNDSNTLLPDDRFIFVEP